MARSKLIKLRALINLPFFLRRSYETLDLLLSLGAVVNQKDVDGWTALHYSALVGKSKSTRRQCFGSMLTNCTRR